MTISTSQLMTGPISGKPNDPWDFWGSLLASRISNVKLLSAPSTTYAENDHREFLDDEIAAISAVLAHLKERRNALYRKPRLPVETMELIFAYAALNEVPGQGRIRDEADSACPFRVRRSGGYNLVPALGWVRLTHVCRAWRAIALAKANKRLWAAMDAGRLSAAGVREMMERSHPHPVAVTITLSTHRAEPLPFVVLFEPQYLARIASLRIAGDTKRPFHGNCNDFTVMLYGARILCTLARRTSDSVGINIESLVIEQDDPKSNCLALPDGLQLPRLRHLVLRNVSHSCFKRLVTYPQLTHLEIAPSDHCKGSVGAFVEGFITFLRGSPDLEVLRLTRWFPCLDSIASFEERDVEAEHIHLPRLKELYLQGSLHDCTQLARHLSPPSSCSITVDTSGDSNPSHDSLSPMLQRWARSSIWRAKLSDSGYGNLSREVEVWYTTSNARANTYASDGCTLPSYTPRVHLAGLPREPRQAHLAPDQVRFWETVDGSVSPGHVVYPLRIYVRNERH